MLNYETALERVYRRYEPLFHYRLSNVHIHHIFPGSRRKLSERYGFTVPLVYYLHEFGRDSVHENPNIGLDLKLKQMAQEYGIPLRKQTSVP